jgi:glucosamine-6-phosphate deaminase
MTSRTYDLLEARIFPDREAMGEAAATLAVGVIDAACAERGEARVIFACAPSQNEFLASLTSPAHRDAIDWAKVVAFHMDEYVGFTGSRVESFRHYLRTHLVQKLPNPPRFEEIRGEAPILADECDRYAALLAERPVDLVCLGFGENGHLAFNDPPVANFEDPRLVKVVPLDQGCRQQQVNDGCFPTLESVPRHALTLTVPALFAARHVAAIVPGARKAEAVRASLLDPVSTACPASILRTHPNAVLHLDDEAASRLPS